MLRIFFLLIFYLSPINTVSGFGNIKLAIYNNSGEFLNKTYISKDVNDTLTLVCKTKLDNVNKYTPRLAWILPTPKNRPHYMPPRPYKVDGTEMSVRLMIEKLEESDYGKYQCVDKNGNKDDASASINLLIRSRTCGKGVYCDHHCIHERFKCDGIQDCKNGKDELKSVCGDNPCQNKIMCEDGRCIPQSWCCNGTNENCTVKWDIKCCPKIRGPVHYNINTDSAVEYGDNRLNYFDHTNLNLPQATVYTVFGCAMLLMLIVTTVLVVVMQCRLNTRRSLEFRQRMYGNNTYHRPLNQEMDLMDMIINRYTRRSGISGHREQQQSRNNHSGLLVTYNVNNGIHIVGKPVEPPPYCEVVPNPPTEQGPPPPYLPRSNEEGENSNNTSPQKKSGRNEKRGLSKVQASSEPTLSNI